MTTLESPVIADIETDQRLIVARLANTRQHNTYPEIFGAAFSEAGVGDYNPRLPRPHTIDLTALVEQIPTTISCDLAIDSETRSANRYGVSDAISTVVSSALARFTNAILDGVNNVVSPVHPDSTFDTGQLLRTWGETGELPTSATDDIEASRRTIVTTLLHHASNHGVMSAITSALTTAGLRAYIPPKEKRVKVQGGFGEVELTVPLTAWGTINDHAFNTLLGPAVLKVLTAHGRITVTH